MVKISGNLLNLDVAQIYKNKFSTVQHPGFTFS